MQSVCAAVMRQLLFSVAVMFACTVLFSGREVAGVKYKGVKIAEFEKDVQLHIAISLKLDKKEELDQLLEDLYNSSSPLYRQYLSSQEFIDRFSPSVNHVSNLVEFLNASNINVTDVDDNRFLVHAQGSVGSLNTAFQTTISYYHDQKEVYFFQPDTKPVIPKGLSINGVHGLHNRTRRRHHSKIKLVSGDKKAKAGSTHLLSPQGIHTAYDVGYTYQGTGQVAALLEFDTYYASDISLYASTYGINEVPIENILINVGGQNAPSSPGSGQQEVTLDIQLLNAMAQDLQQLYVYIAPNSDASTLAVYSQISNDNLASVVSSSWGSPEAQLGEEQISAEAVYFQKMASQGQSMFAAAGDNGAYDNGGDSQLAVDDPGSQPYVTACGGTSLTVSSTNSYESETSWLTAESASGTTGGGGGVSQYHTQPSYQSGVISTASLGSKNHRNVPDVALGANDAVGYAILVTAPGGTTEEYSAGGTSCSAPLWAGFMAIVNQARLSNSLPVMGFFNPTLYTVAQGSNYHSLFHDIADGSTNGFYPAVIGYDESTGWGSFIGDPLISALSLTALGTEAPVSGPSASLAVLSTDAIIGIAIGGGVALIFILSCIIGCVARPSRPLPPKGNISELSLPTGNAVTLT